MRVLKILCVLIAIAYAFSFSIYAAEGGGEAKKAEGKKAEGGAPAEGGEGGKEANPNAEGGDVRIGGKYGPGTDAVNFSDEAIVMEPTATVTPDVEFKEPEKSLWASIRETKALINRCELDLKRYEKFMRTEMDTNLNSLSDAITSMHTAALLDRRDQVEYVWGERVTKTEETLATCEEYVAEFKEDLKEMNTRQKKDAVMLNKNRTKIQRVGEIEGKQKMNDEEIFFVKKGIDKFEDTYKRYVQKYKKAVQDKEQKVAKLLAEHNELHSY